MDADNAHGHRPVAAHVYDVRCVLRSTDNHRKQCICLAVVNVLKFPAASLTTTREIIGSPEMGARSLRVSVPAHEIRSTMERTLCQCEPRHVLRSAACAHTRNTWHTSRTWWFRI